MFQTLYKRNVNGSIQEWTIEVQDDKYRTVSGKKGGKLVISKWTQAAPKNLGRSNQTTPEQQALLEAKAKWVKKTESHYTTKLEEVDQKTHFKVMLAKTYSSWENIQEPIYSQPKLDGVRMVASVEGVVAGRSGKPLHTVPRIQEELREFLKPHPTLTLDGELYNHDLKDDFQSLISMIKKEKPGLEDLSKSNKYLHYFVYDIHCSERPEMDFENRKKLLEGLDLLNLTNIFVVPTTLVTSESHMDLLYNNYLTVGYEGQMLRSGKAIYEQKRSKHLLKRKKFMDSEYEIVDILPGVGQWGGLGKRVKLKGDGVEFHSGIRGTREYCRELLDNKEKYIGKQVTVRYQGKSNEGIPRFPVIHTVHTTEKI